MTIKQSIRVCDSMTIDMIYILIVQNLRKRKKT